MVRILAFGVCSRIRWSIVPLILLMPRFGHFTVMQCSRAQQPLCAGVLLPTHIGLWSDNMLQKHANSVISR